MPDPEFAVLLRGLLTEHGLSMRALARQVPVDAGQLSRVLNGKRRPHPELARRCDTSSERGTCWSGQPCENGRDCPTVPTVRYRRGGA
jgi:hypothetical protein